MSGKTAEIAGVARFPTKSPLDQERLFSPMWNLLRATLQLIQKKRSLFSTKGSVHRHQIVSRESENRLILNNLFKPLVH